MSLIGSPYVSVAAPPRGGGDQSSRSFPLQSMRGSFAWGSSPATATLVYAGSAPLTVGALVNFTVGRHFFAGICKSDTALVSSGGSLRTLEFNDLRFFLTWDWVFGAFNLPDVRLVNGVRLKRYKHLYPGDYQNSRWTYTLAPLNAWQILNAALYAPTVFTQWQVDLTSNGMFGGLLNGPVYEMDCQSGMRLDAFLNLICEKTGLVFCHDPQPGVGTIFGPVNSNALMVGPGRGGIFRLVFTRKGYGTLPLPFPTNSDDRRLGRTLTENATTICVLGDRNKYQVLNVAMLPDWSPAWEQFIEVDLLALDLYNNEINPQNSVAYNNYSAGNAGGDDPERWHGAGDAKARALEMTVGEYAALREARSPGSGVAFTDLRKFAGRWRMDMPAALYIERILFRAFKPDGTGLLNAYGGLVPPDCAVIADQLLVRTLYDPVTGAMFTDNPPQPVDGNGVFLAKGYQVGEDLFRLVQPDRINAAFFSGGTRLWSQVQFQIDDSGEGVRFILADTPVFCSENLLTTVDGQVVLNAAYTLETPATTAALVFEAERYTYWLGGAGGRTRVEPVNGLGQEFVVAGGGYAEVLYADNRTANSKAAEIANSLLLQQPSYLVGGYNLKWDPSQLLAQFGTLLAPANSSCLDRLEITTGPNGVMEVVDFTAERQRNNFEPERELDRRSLQNSLFPGQQELRQQAQDQRRLNAVLKTTPERLFNLFRKLLRGETDGNLFPTKFVPGATLPATLPVGTPILRNPTAGVATAPAVVAAADAVFVGVTVRHNEPTGGLLYVAHTGPTLARVKGPVAVNDAIGASAAGGTDFATNGAYLTGGAASSVGMALEAITDTSVKTIQVQLGSGGGGSNSNSNGGSSLWI